MGSVLTPFLNIGFNLAILHSSGKADGFIDKFIIFPKGRANTSAPPLRYFTGIWSIAAALLVCRLNKIFLTPSSDTFENSKLLDTLHEVLTGTLMFL